MSSNNLNKLLSAFIELVKKPKLLSHIYYDNGIWSKKLHAQYGISALPVIPLGFFMPEEVELPHMVYLDGGSLATDYALLQSIVRRTQECRYFEIGTWRGESVANVCAYAHSCVTLNLPLDDMPADYRSQVGMYSTSKDNVKQIFGDSRQMDFSSMGKYDVVFIDGDHRYEYVKNDTQKVYNHLLHKNSIVVWHDYGNSPEDVRYEVFKGILDGLPKEEHQYLFHVSNTKCAILLREGVDVKELKKQLAVPLYNFVTTIKREELD